MTSHLEEEYQISWQERQTFAENMQPIIGQLFRNKGVEISVYGRPLVTATSIDIIKAHKSVALHEESKLRLRESFPFVEALSKMNLSPARIDIGKLAYRYLFKGESNGLSIEQYLEKELADIGKSATEQAPKDVVLYGFGRIGRLLARELMAKTGKGILGGDNTQHDADHQCGKGHHIVAIAPPKQHPEDGTKKREENDLILSHGVTLASGFLGATSKP